ncbi:MinD/ParA family protein [Streptomyces sp. NPDC060028]|uniref:MinD/ParA family ATP-binding protein n=1 Tax=Streptomyces sp. NPDC060028 TaxID=3347041 RepID=UPI0036840721
MPPSVLPSSAQQPSSVPVPVPVPVPPEGSTAAAPGAGDTAEPSSGASVPEPRRGLRRLGGLLGSRDDPDRLRTVRTTPLRGCHRIAVIGLGAGSGRTTTAAVLGSVLAAERADRVIAVDADAAPGALALGRRVGRETGATVRRLVTELPRLHTYTDIRAYTSRMPGGLEVLADGPGPAASRPFDDREYRGVMDLLGRRYPLVLTDAGAGLSDSPLPGVLELAHQLVLVATPGVDGATSAGTALNWLEEHGFQERARRCVTVFSGVRVPGPTVRADELVAHFATRCRGVVIVPYDEHLAAGSELNPEALRRRTRAAHLELAALVAEGFARPQ